MIIAVLSLLSLVIIVVVTVIVFNDNYFRYHIFFVDTIGNIYFCFPITTFPDSTSLIITFRRTIITLHFFCLNITNILSLSSHFIDKITGC